MVGPSEDAEPSSWAYRRLQRGRVRRHHVFDSRTTDSGDQPGTTLESDIAPAPVQCDDNAIAKADEEKHVCKAPKQPRQEPRNSELPDLHDGTLAPDGSHAAEVAISK